MSRCVQTFDWYYVYVYIHYHSKVWGHLEMSLFLKEKHIFCSLKKHQIDQKYSLDIVNVVNDYYRTSTIVELLWNIYSGVQRPIISNHHSCVPMARCVNLQLC